MVKAQSQRRVALEPRDSQGRCLTPPHSGVAAILGPPDGQDSSQCQLASDSKPSDNTNRSKVRVMIHGITTWVQPIDKTRFEKEMRNERQSKETWTDQEWQDAVRKKARTTYGLSSHGGGGRKDRIRKSADRSMAQPVADHPDASASGEVSAQVITSAVAKPLCNSREPSSDYAQLVATQYIPLLHDISTSTAVYDASGSVAVMRAVNAHGPFVPFTPQPVVNWLYQVLGKSLSVIQDLLGTSASFQRDGSFIDRESGSPACGGMVTVFWGTEIGARRDQAMIAWDYDVDLAAFLTPNFDFDSLWRKASDILEPLGLKVMCHTPGVKYRICPKHALAWDDWKERYQLANLENPNCGGRGPISHIASESKKQHEPLQSPSGTNCVDLEIYFVKPGSVMTIKGSNKIKASCAELFPIVEGVFGPLRVPLPATPKILDAEYGSRWRHARSAKVIGKAARSKYVDVTCAHTRRCVWPSIPLRGCSELLGGFYGAGLDSAEEDVEWRFES